MWDDKEEKWYFCVVDVVEALTDSANPTDYIKKMKKRDPELAKGWGQIVTPLLLPTPGGKQRINCATQEGLFRCHSPHRPSGHGRHAELWNVVVHQSVQRPTSNKTKNSNRNQKETEGRLTAAPSRAYYYNILGNLYAKMGSPA